MFLMKVLIVDNGTSYIEKMINLFDGCETEIAPFNSSGLERNSLYDLIVLSGGHIFDLENQLDKYNKEIELIKSTRVPILGVCLGCELIAVAFGGKMRSLDHFERGVMKIEIVTENEMFDGVDSGFEVYENHRRVIDKLPDCFEILAVSDDGIEMFKYKNKQIYGMQFHPEMFREIGTNRTLIVNLLKFIQKI